MTTVPLGEAAYPVAESAAEPLPSGAEADQGAHLATVARIVGAARVELCQRHDLSVRAVARRAGMGPREMTGHVGSRQELVRRVLFEIAVDAHATMAAVPGVSASGSCRDRLLAYARAYRVWAVANPVEFSVLLGPASRPQVDEETFAQGMAWFYGPLLEIFRTGVERGQVDLSAAVPQGRSLPSVRPAMLEALQNLDPRLAVALMTLSTGMHGYLMLEACGQLGAVFADTDRAFDTHVRGLIDAAGVA